MASRATAVLDAALRAADTGRAMSQENVEVVRGILAEFATTHRGVPRLTTPDVVWDMGTFRGWPDVPEYMGTEGFNEFFAKWTGPYWSRQEALEAAGLRE
jgi:hypothetical protein